MVWCGGEAVAAEWPPGDSGGERWAPCPRNSRAGPFAWRADASIKPHSGGWRGLTALQVAEKCKKPAVAALLRQHATAAEKAAAEKAAAEKAAAEKMSSVTVNITKGEGGFGVRISAEGVVKGYSVSLRRGRRWVPPARDARTAARPVRAHVRAGRNERNLSTTSRYMYMYMYSIPVGFLSAAEESPSL